MMAAPLDDLFATPAQHFLSFDGNDGLFMAMDRDSYHRSIFLDRRLSALQNAPTRMALAPLFEASRELRAPRTGWIFHVAHCGSTLLSQLIDNPRSGLVLREPPPLRQLGLAHASGVAGADWTDRLQLAAALAARRFNPSHPSVIKANVPVNFIMAQLCGLDPQAPAIFLHFALEPYLLAVLGGEGTRLWVDRLTSQLLPALAARVGLAADATTAERAAALWLAQMLIFNEALKTFEASASLDAEAFFAAPAAMASKVAAHFGLGSIAADSTSLASVYSKDPSRSFTEADRLARQADRRAAIGADIIAARRWIERSSVSNRLPDRLPKPLAGESPLLLA